MPEENPTVLVVDDEPNVAEAYALWLDDDYEVLTAHDGQEALETITEAVDVVLLDRRMPKMSGDEALERLREEGYDCRVAMVTAVDPDFDIVDMPFDAYLTKPVTRENVVETVEELLDLSEYDDAVQRQFAIAEKKAALEAEKSSGELGDSEEFRQLDDEFADLAEETDEAVEEMDHETLKAAMSDLDDDDHEAASF